MMENKGLTTSEAEKILEISGANEIPEESSGFDKILRKIISPISLMLLAAAFLSLLIGEIFDYYFILILLFLNIAISLWQESKADNAIKKLNEHLSGKIKTLRGGKWVWVDSRQIVKGDIIQIASGEVIPADGKIIDGKEVSVNESSLTGESLPKDKKMMTPCSLVHF